MVAAGKGIITLKHKSEYYACEINSLEAFTSSDLTIKSFRQIEQLNRKIIRKIAAGQNHILFLTESGVLYSMGKNDYGQLGYTTDSSSNSNENVPQLITHLINFRVFEIAAGQNHSVAIITSRTKSGFSQCETNKESIVMSWGNNEYGQLGLGNKAWHEKEINLSDNTSTPNKEFYKSVCTPSAIENLPASSIISLGCGSNYIAILSKDGVYLYGDNAKCQLSYSLLSIGESVIRDALLLSAKQGVIAEVKCSLECLVIHVSK